MSRRLFILSTTLTLLGVMGGQVWSSQLDGLQIEAAGDRVQVILDIDKTQPYRVDHTPEAGTSIMLPNAKLPEAFRGTGLPPVMSPEAGVMAMIQESEGGLRIQLQGGNADKVPYEIRFRSEVAPVAKLQTPKPKAPVALLKPEKQEIKNLYRQLNPDARETIVSQPELTAPRATQTQKAPVQSVRPAPRPQKVTKAPPPPLLQTARSVPVAKTPPPAPVQKAPPKVVSEAEAPARASQQVASAGSSQESGYTFMHQAEAGEVPETVEDSESMTEEELMEAFLKDVEAQTETPESAGIGAPAFPTMGEEDQPRKSLLQQAREKSGLASGSMMRWVLIAGALLGGLILILIGLLFWARSRSAAAAGYLDEGVPADDYFNDENLQRAQPANSAQQGAARQPQSTGKFAEYFVESQPQPPMADELPEYFEERPAPMPPMGVAHNTAPSRQPQAEEYYEPPTPPMPQRPPSQIPSPLPVAPVAQPKAPAADTQPPVPKPVLKPAPQVQSAPRKAQGMATTPRPQPKPRSLQPEVATESLLVHPASSVGDAVRSSLGSRTNPYLTAPFKVSGFKGKNTLGGPKPRRTPRPL